MRIVYLTAGAAGMYCGSCLQDNAVVKALLKLGHDAVLVPTYTPILTDESSVSCNKLFYGGLNVYLQQLAPILRWVPPWMDQFLSSPRLVNWVASKSMSTSAKRLGALTVSMLRGREGRQRKEVDRLVHWLTNEMPPEVVVFSNLLIGGAIPEIKRRLNCPVVVILQGDDIFFDELSEPFKSDALALLRKLATQIDLFLVHSQEYGQRMQSRLGFSNAAWKIAPLAIDPTDFLGLNLGERPADRPPTIGYLARLAPEKGLHTLVESFIELRKLSGMSGARLAIAGWLGKQHEGYWDRLKRQLREAGLESSVHYHGSVDRAGKVEFLRSIDVLSVPTSYAEPKGLFVLEALAAGVPVVQPAHGAFPEMLQTLGGGVLFEPHDVHSLAHKLHVVLSSLSSARELGAKGREAMLRLGTTIYAAERVSGWLQELVEHWPVNKANAPDQAISSEKLVEIQ